MAGTPAKHERRERLAALLSDEPKILNEILEYIAAGQGLHSWTQAHDVPYTNVLRWVNSDPQRRAEYDAARIAGAHALVEKSLRVFEDVATGTLENGATDNGAVSLAKAKSETMRWIASRIAPRDWGDKVELNQHVEINVTFRALMEKREQQIKESCTTNAIAVPLLDDLE